MIDDNHKLAHVLRTLAVKHLCLDSRKLRAGDAFFALHGASQAGVNFIESAVSKGALAIICDKADQAVVSQLEHVDYFFVPALSTRLSAIAHCFYDKPSDLLTVIGITGTNGKTSCAHFLAQSLRTLDKKVAVLGTVGNGIYPDLEPAQLTTMDALSVQRHLHDYAKSGVHYVVMEVSSHALVQHRVAAVHFTVAALTNITQDHLDYHGTMTAYTAAKRCLFDCESLQHIILNSDDDVGKNWLREMGPQAKVVSYGVEATEHFTPDIHMLGLGKAWQKQTNSMLTWHNTLRGCFNQSNQGLVVAVLYSLNYKAVDVQRAMSHLVSPPGRMMWWVFGNAPAVVIDFAHTPDALKQLLMCVKSETAGKLWCVFGCGGDRDSSKRGKMGAIAEDLSDHLILTNDNPRTESPQKIVADILSGCLAPNKVRCILDREQAIHSALSCAKAADVVVIAGKGHEAYQEIAGKRYDFNDALVVKCYVENQQ